MSCGQYILDFLPGYVTAFLESKLRTALTRCIGYTAFLNPFSAKDFVINYILIPVFVLLYLGYKFWHKTKIVRPEDMDIWTGRREDVKYVDPEKERSIFWRIKNVVVG